VDWSDPAGNLDLEGAFVEGLRLNSQGYEADPTRQPQGSMKRLNILTHHVNGKYRRGKYDNIRTAVQDILAALAPMDLRAIVAVGGLIIGKAAAAELQSRSSTLPLACILGRKNSDVEAYGNAGGFYFDDNTTVTQTLSSKINELLGYSMMDPTTDAKKNVVTL
jgi:hypothetical protein